MRANTRAPHQDLRAPRAQFGGKVRPLSRGPRWCCTSRWNPPGQDPAEHIYLGDDLFEELRRLMRLHPSATGFSSQFISTEIVKQHPNHPSLAR